MNAQVQTKPASEKQINLLNSLLKSLSQPRYTQAQMQHEAKVLDDQKKNHYFGLSEYNRYTETMKNEAAIRYFFQIAQPDEKLVGDSRKTSRVLDILISVSASNDAEGAMRRLIETTLYRRLGEASCFADFLLNTQEHYENGEEVVIAYQNRNSENETEVDYLEYECLMNCR